VSRTTIIVLLAIGATLAGFALSTNARRLQDDEVTARTRVAAGPQRATLGWRETFGPAGEQLVFSVERLEILQDGWRAEIGLENQTSIPYEVAGQDAAQDRTFGLMLFSSGEITELEEKNESGTLPAIRPALRFEPQPPTILEPGGSWAGTISAPGALVADSWVRVVFGALVSVGSPPDDVAEYVVWITDHAHRLHAPESQPQISIPQEP
jgi:hypothetical protein